MSWQKPSRWTFWVRSISNSEQMIKPVSNCREAGGTRCRQSFGRGRVFCAWISNIKVNRHGAEINTTLLSSSHGWWFLSRSRWGKKTRGYTERHFLFSYHRCKPNPAIYLDISECRQTGLFRSKHKLKLCFMVILKCVHSLSHTNRRQFLTGNWTFFSAETVFYKCLWCKGLSHTRTEI